MQDTVAVALITSLSTLAAAALTGLIAARSTRRQLAHQLTIAQQESADRSAARREELRRDAYVGFLGACDAAYRRLDRRWIEPGADAVTPGYDETYAAMRGRGRGVQPGVAGRSGGRRGGGPVGGGQPHDGVRRAAPACRRAG
ncbi:hypothetical protein ACLQ24_24085 [Micromonospora sp. DT4]|uniref:hypothetical protein n=1 Tax=Micromonospora sp. DT4 TaxID=3393438 RepID=UPI003CECA44D